MLRAASRLGLVPGIPRGRAMGSPVAESKQVKDDTPHCLCGEEKDQVGEPQNLDKPRGRGLPALLGSFCQLDARVNWKKDSQLRGHLPQVDLWVCLWGVSLMND